MMSLLAAAYSGLAIWKENSQYRSFGDFPSGLEAVLSLAIGMLLAFRANRAFDRWWEARTLWGTLVNASRNLAVKTNNLVTPRDESFETMHHLIVAFPRVLRDSLRNAPQAESLAPLRQDLVQGHAPSWVVNQMYGILENWKRDQRIDHAEFWILDREAKIFLEVCGGCERIKNTPIALSYRVFLIHALALFVLTLPWGIVNQFGYWTIPITFFTSYFTIAAEGIASHVEQPFTVEGDGLDLDGLCQTIQSSVDNIFETQPTIER